MDRPLSHSDRRRATARRIVTIGGPIAAVAAILLLLPGWIRPTLSRSKIRTAIVAVGALDEVITASGTVVPEIERIIASPVDARLVHVLKRPGAPVTTGEPIVELDTSESQLAYERLLTDVEISDNQQAQTAVALEKSLADLDGQIERRVLDAQSLDDKARNAAQLFTEGLVAQQTVRDADVAAKQAHIELNQLRNQRALAQRSTDLQATGLQLQRAALRRSAADARRVLRLATASSDRDGVLTYVLSQEGALVHRGDVIARIADLRSFRVDASVPDVHGGRIHPGMTVTIRTNGIAIGGQVTDVLPTIENGTLQFRVGLEEPSHRALRPSLAVDALLVTDHRGRVPKVKQGPYTDNTGSRGQVFVIRGDRAYRTDVSFGLRGYDELEIASGLQAGDEVIISDMRDYLHLKEVGIR